MSQFATADELAARLDVDFTEDEGERADAHLTLASGLIQASARQVIEMVEDDELTRRGSRESSIILPERPVVEVSAVTLRGRDVTGWYLDGDELVRSSGAGLRSEDPFASCGAWGSPDSELVITYTHGYEEIPDAIKAICLECVVRVYAMKDLSDGVSGLWLMQSEKDTICRVTGRRVSSSPLR
jgi:hypothetical protein